MKINGIRYILWPWSLVRFLLRLVMPGTLPVWAKPGRTTATPIASNGPQEITE